MNKERNIRNESIFSEESSPDPVVKAIENAEKALENANDTTEETKAEHKNRIPDYESFFNDTDNSPKGIGLRFIFKFLKNQWGNIFLAVLFCLLKITSWVAPLIIANIINAVTESGPNAVRTITINVIVWLIYIFVMSVPFNILHHKYANKVIRNVVAGLRSTLIRKLQHLSITYHTKMESGKIQSKFLRDIESVENLLVHFTYG